MGKLTGQAARSHTRLAVLWCSPLWLAACRCPCTHPQVWRKAADCDTFNPAHASSEMRRRLVGGKDPAELSGPLLLYVGRVSSEKNVELLKPVLQRLPGARLAIVGDGPAMQVE